MTLVNPVTFTNINDKGHTWAGAGGLVVSHQALSAFALRAPY